MQRAAYSVQGTSHSVFATRICFLLFSYFYFSFYPFYFFPPFSVVHFLVLLLPLLLLLESVECLRKVTKLVSSSAASLPARLPALPAFPLLYALPHSLRPPIFTALRCDTWLKSRPRPRPGARSSTFSVPFCST